MFHRFNVTLVSLILAVSLAANSAEGAISYLLIQGEFDSGSSGVETYKWKVDYIGSSLITGQDLLNAVFGAPVLVSGSTYMAGNSSHGVNYTYYDGLGYSPQQFFTSGLAGPLTPVVFDGNYWAYYNAGGGYDDTSGFADPASAAYADNIWTSANTGSADRKLLDRDLDANLNEPSFDGYIYGTGSPNPSGNPADSFVGQETLFLSGAGYTVYSMASTPEPSRSVLLLFAAIALMTRRSRSLRATC